MKRLSPAVLVIAMACTYSCVQAIVNKKGTDNKTEASCGAYTDFREVSADELELFSAALEDFLATKEVCTIEGCSIPSPWDKLEGCTPSQVRTQVVAGTNFQFKCPGCIVTVFKPLPGQGEAKVSHVDFQN